MVRDALYFIGLMIVAYGAAGWYVWKSRRARKQLEEQAWNQKVMDRFKDRYLAGEIDLPTYEAGIKRYEAMEERKQ